MSKLRVWVWDSDLGIVHIDVDTIQEAYHTYKILRGRVNTSITVGIEVWTADNEWEDWRGYINGVEYTEAEIDEYIEKIGE